jgi:UDP-N-acetylmuramoyl-L-alanine---L-glutamate ligase
MITWDELRGKRVAVWGLGREGKATVRKLTEVGAGDIVLADDHPADDTVHPTSSGVLETVDVVIKSPGISRYRPELDLITARNIPVLGGLGLWLASMTDDARDRTVCITGTKGKSTTTAILAHLLNGLGYTATTGGNIGVVPWDPQAQQEQQHQQHQKAQQHQQYQQAKRTPEAPGSLLYSGTYYVIEVSSYQATDIQIAPPTVAVTSLHPDHLDWHGGVERYYRDKLSLCTKPGVKRTVVNGDSDLLRTHESLLGQDIDWVTSDEPADWAQALQIPGEHNKRNALIAKHCIAALGIRASDEELAKAADGYEGLPSRLKTIGTVNGVTFVDDSLSTNVLPTIAALDAYRGKRIALIAGGHDRGIDYAPLAEAIAARTDSHNRTDNLSHTEDEAPVKVFTLPGSGDRIHTALEASGLAAEKTEDLMTAVQRAYEWAREGGFVLLSPASPSFGQFRDYRDRSDAFAQAMRSIAGHAINPP